MGQASSKSKGGQIRRLGLDGHASTDVRTVGEGRIDRPVASVVDLFCGAGGLTHGFRLEGFDVAAGVDMDEACRFAYEHNNGAPFLRKDVGSLAADELADLFYQGVPRVLVGCAPCQPFSSYNQKNDDPKWRLVDKFGELIEALLPEIVSMENVRRLLNFQGGEVFRKFEALLKRNGYWIDQSVAFAPGYGVPQRRSRLVLLASRLGPIALEAPSFLRNEYLTVGSAIGQLRPLAAGGIDEADPLHRASRLSPTNAARIRASKPGGTWRDWDAHLVAECHRLETGNGYSSVYGRMAANAPAPTITTQFFGFGNGRFGHPDQDLGLSLREGAILQSFPPDYAFFPPGADIQFKNFGRMVGNAVPVLLARAIARSIKANLAAKVE